MHFYRPRFFRVSLLCLGVLALIGTSSMLLSRILTKKILAEIHQLDAVVIRGVQKPLLGFGVAGYRIEEMDFCDMNGFPSPILAKGCEFKKSLFRPKQTLVSVESLDAPPLKIDGIKFLIEADLALSENPLKGTIETIVFEVERRSPIFRKIEFDVRKPVEGYLRIKELVLNSKELSQIGDLQIRLNLNTPAKKWGPFFSLLRNFANEGIQLVRENAQVGREQIIGLAQLIQRIENEQWKLEVGATCFLADERMELVGKAHLKNLYPNAEFQCLVGEDRKEQITFKIKDQKCFLSGKVKGVLPLFDWEELPLITEELAVDALKIIGRGDFRLACTEQKEKLGDAISLYLIGMGYLSEGDFHSAINWLRKSAGMGNALAFLHLSELHLKGKGIESNRLLARNFLNEAFDKGLLWSELRSENLDPEYLHWVKNEYGIDDLDEMEP